VGAHRCRFRQLGTACHGEPAGRGAAALTCRSLRGHHRAADRVAGITSPSITRPSRR
jgi:hypothetical protein